MKNVILFVLLVLPIFFISCSKEGDDEPYVKTFKTFDSISDISGSICIYHYVVDENYNRRYTPDGNPIMYYYPDGTCEYKKGYYSYGGTYTFSDKTAHIIWNDSGSFYEYHYTDEYFENRDGQYDFYVTSISTFKSKGTDEYRVSFKYKIGFTDIKE